MTTTAPHLTADQRRRQGSYYTPTAIAQGLVELATDGMDLSPATTPRVCDPAVGTGSFALAAARRLERAGHDRVTIVEELIWGADIDARAVAATRAALAAWALEATDPPTGGVEAVHVVVGDSLAAGRSVWPDAPPSGFRLVVGNPPFLNQLARRTGRAADQNHQLAQRLGPAVRPYADTAALALADGVNWLAPGGRLALVLPESVLATRDAGPARAAVLADSSLVAFWWAGQAVFDAGVDVCALVVERGAPVGPVRRFFGPGFDPVDEASAPTPRPDQPARSWSWLLDRSAPALARAATALDRTTWTRHPGTSPRPTGRLGGRVEATAGFRDQFYGVAPFVHEADDTTGPDAVRLITAGTIDPLHRRREPGVTRFAGRRWAAPVVDVDAVRGADERLGRWADARLVPKVVLATQTRVLEPVVDRRGRWWPSVPVIAITPRSGDPDELWAIAAVLASPAVSVWASSRYRGAALSSDAIKLSASQVLEIPLPVDAGAWAHGAELAGRAQGEADADRPETWHQTLVELGRVMTAAYRAEAEVHQWWTERLPAWR